MTIQNLLKLCLGIGIIVMGAAMSADVTVNGYVNLQKINQQNNLLFLGGILFLAGVIGLVASRFKGGGLSEQVQEKSPPQVFSEYADALDLSQPNYQLFLTKWFSIELNPTLQKYTMGDDGFNSLDEALREADRRYSARQESIKTEKEREQQETAQLAEGLAVEHAEWLRLSEERERLREASVARRIALWKKFRIPIAVVVVAALVGVGGYSVVSKKRAAEQARKRDQLLSAMIRSGTFFGFTLGENNRLKLSATLLGDTPRDGPRIICSNQREAQSMFVANCNSLPDFESFSPVVDSIGFSYCGSKLWGVVLQYSSDAEARASGIKPYEQMVNSVNPKLTMNNTWGTGIEISLTGWVSTEKECSVDSEQDQNHGGTSPDMLGSPVN